jgi:spore coat polysaccharide biosynthesis predicted glycosyltransferase SpsG
VAHVIFRLAAGQGVGLGHAARCAALARAMARRGHSVLGLVRGAGGAEAAELRGLPSRPADDGVAELVAAARETQAAAIVLDDYDFSEDMIMKTVGAVQAATLVLDDSGERRTAAAAVWNGAPGATAERYVVAGGTVLAGLSFALVGGAARDRSDRDYERPVERVFVSAGALGERSVTTTAISIIRTILPAARIALVDAMFAAAPPIADVAVTRIRSNDLSAEMAASDLAVSAAGQTAIELASVGTPTVVVPVVDNQRPNAEGLDAMGIALNAGPCWSADFEVRLRDAIERCATSGSVRARLGRAGRAAVDGRGADRTAAAFELILQRYAA